MDVMNEQELKERAIEIVENNLYLVNGVMNGLYRLKEQVLKENPELSDEIEIQFKDAILGILREKLAKETKEDPQKIIEATEDLDYNTLASYNEDKDEKL
jgi:hypothetical protein